MKHSWKYSLLIACILVGTLIFPSFGAHSTAGISQNTLISSSPLVFQNNSSWLNQTQVFDMLALPPNRVKSFHVTVNGLWNGFFIEGENLSGPFEMGKYLESFYSGRTYTSDAEFVQTQHEKGLIVPGTILTTQGHPALQGDLIEDFACRSADGHMATWDLNAGSYFICSQNPNAIDWMISHGKKAIDAGADMITLDEIEGNGLVGLLQYVSAYTEGVEPGFCPHCIEGFRSYLENHFSSSELTDLFGIQNLTTYEFIPRIAATMNLSYFERIRTDPLIKEYFRFQEEGTFEAKKRLITELRAYATMRNKTILISANSFALGTSQTGDYLIQGLQFSELLDFFSFENKYTALPDQSFPTLPRSKWVAWEKLARAATHAQGVILVDSAAMGKLWQQPFFLKKLRNYLAVHCAEAYANQGAFVNWFVKPFDQAFRWNGCAQIYDFVLQNRELYDAVSSVDTSVAVVYLFGEGMRNNTANYLGLCQALAESNIPFDVVFDGDGTHLNDSLALRDLSSYQMILLPSIADITAKQETVLKEYVHSGGVALIFDPQGLGLPAVEGPYPYGDGVFYIMLEKKPALYYQTYEETYRTTLQEILDPYIPERLTIENANRKIVGYPYYQLQEGRHILHLINYDCGALFDIIWPKSDIAIRLKLRLPTVSSISVISPDFNGRKNLPFTIVDGYVEFSVPTLRIYDVVSIET